jgi:hypothetical protein
MENTKEMELSDYFKLNETKELDIMVAAYAKENGGSPFTDINMKDDDTGEVVIDMKSDFEEVIVKRFDNLDAVLGDYITAIITEAMENSDVEDLMKAAKEMGQNEEADTK